MSSKEITAIAIKFFGIYLLVNIVIYFPSFFATLSALENYHGQDFDNSVFILVVGAFILLGFVVSFFLFKLANSICSQAPESSGNTSTLSQEFLLQVLGTYFIVASLTAMPSVAISIFAGASINLLNALHIIGYIFQVFVGIYLLTKPSFWVQCFNKFRGRS